MRTDEASSPVSAAEDALDGQGQRLYRTAKRLIPGGTQLLSKRPEMILPDHWPTYYSRAAGVEVWDLDGRLYVDMSYSGIGSCVLGFADPDVGAAVKAAIDAGSMATLNCAEEVELAELLCELHPWADMVRYARGGGEAMALAVRIARARTRRDMVAFSGYHGWHDWYLAANLAEQDALDGHLLPGLDPLGVPRGLQGSALPFTYNHIEELEQIVRDTGGRLAAIVMEPMRSSAPEPGYFEAVRAIADDTGAVLIFDEITSGLRLNTGGIHLLHSVMPDIAVFAKALGNGYPMAAVIGRGGIMQAAQGSFISSTYWTERIGPTAALATLRKHREQRVGDHLVRVGRRVKDGWLRAAESAGLAIHVSGLDPLAHFAIDAEDAQAAYTLFAQLMLERGYLATKAFYATFSHQDHHIDAYLDVVEEVFAAVAKALAQGSLRTQLRGPVAHAGFRRLT